MAINNGLPRSNLVLSFVLALLVSLAGISTAHAQAGMAGYGFAAPGGYGVKIYKVESALYPYIQVYFRTFTQDQMPLVNLNERNIGLMVKGRSYNPMKLQYRVQSLQQRQEATRTVLVIDASGSMKGKPFESALRAAVRYIDSKRPQDEIAILSIEDTKEGYKIISDFERDPGALGRRLADMRATAQKTRLYDTVGAAMQMCGLSSQGSVSPSPSNYIVSCSIVVFSDGKDEGSALSREEVNARITNLSVPIPIYSLAYTKINPDRFRNLEALSKNSFGKYYLIGEAYDEMQRVVEEIQYITQNDYVLTFRAYVPVDGNRHPLKVGLDYPSGSGKYIYDDTSFEAIEPPPVPALMDQIARMSQIIAPLPDGNPYFDKGDTMTPPAATSGTAK